MLTPEIRDRIIKEELIRLANSMPSNSQLIIDKVVKPHIERRTGNKTKIDDYLAFYLQQIGNQEKTFNPRYIEALPKI